jgi:hypothetical protein
VAVAFAAPFLLGLGPRLRFPLRGRLLQLALFGWGLSFAIEDLSEPFLELDETNVPASYIVRLRAEQGGLRKALLRVY